MVPVATMGRGTLHLGPAPRAGRTPVCSSTAAVTRPREPAGAWQLPGERARTDGGRLQGWLRMVCVAGWRFCGVERILRAMVLPEQGAYEGSAECKEGGSDGERE